MLAVFAEESVERKFIVQAGPVLNRFNRIGNLKTKIAGIQVIERIWTAIYKLVAGMLQADDMLNRESWSEAIRYLCRVIIVDRVLFSPGITVLQKKKIVPLPIVYIRSCCCNSLIIKPYWNANAILVQWLS
ncbi:hypothetical protein D3C86_1126790 [compost metagenome]